MKKVSYFVSVEKDPDSDWGASVPDLPGCVAVGRTLPVVLRRIRGSIELHLAGLRAEGRRAPRPRQRVTVSARRPHTVALYAWVDVAA